MDVVEAIVSVPKDSTNKPYTPITLHIDVITMTAAELKAPRLRGEIADESTRPRISAAPFSRWSCSPLLLGGSLWILRPFILPTVWATMIVVATWPWLKWLQKRFGGRRGPAVAVMTMGLLLLLLVPLGLVVFGVISNADEITKWVHSLATWQMPPAPAFLGEDPDGGRQARRDVGGGGGGRPRLSSPGDSRRMSPMRRTG